MSEIIGMMNTISRPPVSPEELHGRKLKFERVTNDILARESAAPGGTPVAEMPEAVILRRCKLDAHWGQHIGLPELERRDLAVNIPRDEAINAAWQTEQDKIDRAARVLETARLALLQEERDKGLTRKDFWQSSAEQLVESVTTVRDDRSKNTDWKMRYMNAVQAELLQRQRDKIPENVSPRRFLNRTEPE